MHQRKNMFESRFVAIPRVRYILRGQPCGGEEKRDLPVMPCGRAALQSRQMSAVHGIEIVKIIEICPRQCAGTLPLKGYAMPCGNFDRAPVWRLANMIGIRTG